MPLITLGVSNYKYMGQICEYIFSWVAHVYFDKKHFSWLNKNIYNNLAHNKFFF